jgi:hypothetical protein
VLYQLLGISTSPIELPQKQRYFWTLVNWYAALQRTVLMAPIADGGSDAPYELFLDTIRISDPFSSKAEAWDFAEKRGLVTILPSRDEDPPRRFLALKYSIRLSEDLAGRNVVQPPVCASQTAAR